ncbi:chromosome segregation protein SMC [Frondihabitans australicus]|uniref:Chromosome partition protein Smc n=1 Tax=Frondihabitans australicus TaxID=386892 RepID=A0A495IE96_9MICO|nr:chromosome segregation protein SMC [Frondihabitans australicus]RKR73661.1 condensin subunit Smc [Frondihabitans australicus]
MYLKSLTLKGFKSFAQPTTFAFEPGVTCVVGPNGSGKSNVVDALAWVMGEQGVKTLRGGKMEDVIFAGTSTRGPLGRAQVVLTIDNSDGALPIDYTEVTISRTLFRNGGSEYAINGEGCRLLDVQELLSDSGLGREMHVIVGQGQLDAVLRATPEERRGFIEEAAGILKHRRRKEKTIRKLEAMQTNLTRLSDLAGEIRRQLKPLGRQAEIAREAQGIAAVVRDAKARLLADEVVTLREALTTQSKNENERKSERIVLQEQLDQNKLREQRLEQAMVGDAVDDARRITFGLESVQERLRSLQSLANQKLTLLAQQADGPGVASTVSSGMVADAQDEAERLAEGVAEAELAVAQAAAEVATARASLDSLDDEIAAQSALVSQHDLEVARLASAVEVARSKLAAVKGEQLRQSNALEASEARRESSREEFAALDSSPEAIDEGAGAAGEPAEPIDHAAAQQLADERVQATQADVETFRDRLHALERERDGLAARTSALSLALDQNDASSALVAAARPGVRGLVAEHVQVEPGYEVAIAAALGSVADAVLADTEASAFGAVEHVTAEELGRVEVVWEHVPAEAQEPAQSLPAGAVAAASVVTAPPGILRALAFTAIADDLAGAHAVADDLSRSGRPFTVITRAGEAVTGHSVRGGSAGGRSRLELVAERDTAAEALTGVSIEIERAADELAAAREANSEARTAAKAAATAAREEETRRAAHDQRASRLRAALDAAEAETERLATALQASAENVHQAERAVQAAVSAHEEYSAQPRPILDVSARDGVLAEVENARGVEIEKRIQLETIRERVRAEVSRAKDLQRQLDEQRAAAEEHARQTVIRQRQMAATTRVLDALPSVLDAVDRSVSEARGVLAARESERSTQNAELATLRAEERTLRERLHAVTENVHGLEMEIYEKKLHLSSLLERAGSELGLVESVLVDEYGPEVGIPAATDDDPDALPLPYDRKEQKARLAKAERTLAQLGRVNPLALEEFAALEQRHKFLTDQLTDLTETRKDLLEIIAEIDEKMQAIFQSAFDDTKEAFNRVFPILFPGGSGSIQLTDPENLLETGIEVTVKPAGKKIERLSLLSGGERSLAAVALLIAIFKARPSPFYIMDEVEAALDDANLGRLLTIFQDLRENSQLIVITHQKRTMEIADALYGVSMRQDGVSAVVGQRVVSEAERAQAAS